MGINSLSVEKHEMEGHTSRKFQYFFAVVSPLLGCASLSMNLPG